MDSYVLFRGSKRVTFKDEDMTVDKISRIFQVNNSSVYLTDDRNTAIFPGSNGFFSSIDLANHGHYEVHGQDIEATPPAFASAHSRFSFIRSSPSASAGSPGGLAALQPPVPHLKYFQRTIHIGEVRAGTLVPTRVVVVRFTESEATVSQIADKVKEALGTAEPVVLTDNNGNEILDSQGTRGSLYWKQNSRKVMGVLQADFRAMTPKRKRTSMNLLGASEGLEEVLGKIEELLLASQQLPELTKTLRDLIDHTSPLSFIAQMKETFLCTICKDVMENPMFSSCCCSILACEICLEQWKQASPLCPKCTSASPDFYKVAGLSSSLGLLKNFHSE